MIAVHAGAGYHSPALEATYKRDLAAACRAGAVALAGGDALAAVCAAIRVLETSSHCNAGCGSNLSFGGHVECDASVMTGDGAFGAVAAAPGIQHPIDAAALLARESWQPLSNGRVRPMMLAGDRAREWALSRCLPAAGTPAQAAVMHVTERAQKQWRKYRTMVDGGRTADDGSGGGGCEAGSSGCAVQQEEPRGQGWASKRCRLAEGSGGKDRHQRQQEQQEREEQQRAAKEDVGCLYDTVGCVVLAPGGGIAAGVSSGGIVLKTEGRVGEAALYGAGCWAQRAQAPPSSPPLPLPQQQLSQKHRWRRQPNPHQSQLPGSVAVACSVTGVGEQVMRHLLARECCLEAAAVAPEALPGAAAGTAATAAAGPHVAAGAAATEAEADVPLAQLAAQLLQRTILQGPVPHDCGLLCLKAQELEACDAGADGGSVQPAAPRLQQRLRGASSGSLQPPGAGSRSVQQLASQAAKQQQQQHQGPPQPEQQQGQRRYVVEVAVAHSSQSMAFGHMACPAAGERGTDGVAAGNGSDSRVAAPAVFVLRRLAGCSGQPAVAVQTYLHGATMRL